ncbi:hypothetical protein EAKF1_ch2934c [Escherichia albertii KF1]|nr:hypothetical protein EAKF1_ch2934c [Escherichia albertii KF1]
MTIYSDILGKEWHHRTLFFLRLKKVTLYAICELKEIVGNI